MKQIEETKQYFIFEWDYQDMPITFRKWKNADGYVEIKVNENFARANGYNSVKEMIKGTIGESKLKEVFGCVPEWIRANGKGEFFFCGLPLSMLN